MIIVLFTLQLYYSPLRDAAAAQDLLKDAEKQAFFLMTNIRIVLVKFITPSGFDPELVTESLKKSFYFAVSDWDVLASCYCNGQASECDPVVSLGKNEFIVPIMYGAQKKLEFQLALSISVSQMMLALGMSLVSRPLA